MAKLRPAARRPARRARCQAAAITRHDPMRRSFLLCALSLIAILAAAPSKAQSGAPGQAALNTEVRMNALEDQMRDLTGRIEELNNNLRQLKQQLDRLSSDVDLRFSQMQGQGAAGAPPAATGAPQNATAAP